MRSAPFRGVSALLALSTLALTLALGNSSAFADELAERKAIDRALQPFYHQQQFGQLEAMADDLRTSKARTGSGVWKLTVFYSTLQWLNSEDFVASYPNGSNWKKLEAWIAATPTAPTPHILKAFAFKSLAMMSGRRIAEGALPHSGWRPDAAYLKEARKVLEDAKSFAARDPHYYAVLVDLMPAEGADLQDILVVHAEATAREPLYYQTHFAVFEHLLVATANSDVMASTFANTVYRATAAAEGEAVYARLYWMAFQRVYGPAIFEMAPIDWDRMRKGLGLVVKSYPTGWNAQHSALFACLKGDQPMAHEMLGVTSDPPIAELWQNQLLHKACIKFAAR
jgi:hypothetical protein